MIKTVLGKLNLIVILRYSYQAFTGEHMTLVDAKRIVDAYMIVTQGVMPVVNGDDMDNFFKFCKQAIKTRHIVTH